MNLLKNPFGLRNGKIVMIADLKESERGERCGCVCPYCKAHFVARLGEVRQPHFAHNGKPCDEVVAVMTAAYTLLREAIEESGSFTYPACYGTYFDMSSWEEASRSDVLQAIKWSQKKPVQSPSGAKCSQVIKEAPFGVVQTEICKTQTGMPNALILTASNQHKLALILVPPKTICKIPTPIPFKNLPTVVIRLPDELYHVTSDHLREKLRNGIESKEWLSSPKMEHWIEELLDQHRKNHETWLIKEQERTKRQTEREKQIAAERAEQRKQEEQKKANLLHSYTEEERIRYNQLFRSKHLEESTVQVHDKYDHRWCFCKTCKTWYPTEEMTIYGGSGIEINHGLCCNCNRKLRD